MKSVGLCPPENEFSEIIKEMNLDESNKMDFPEFIVMMSYFTQEVQSKEEIKFAFDLFDKEGKGILNADDIRKGFITIGEPFEDDEIREMIREYDQDGDNMINFEDFSSMLKNVSSDA